jgi:iron complex transport system permease protein
MILIGIGVSSLLAAVTTFIVARADLGAAQAARIWLTGSLNGRGWTDVQIGLVGTALLVPVLVGLGPGLRMSEMGDDTARALGVPVDRNRVCALGFGAVLCAVGVVCAGPITFVALAAPQIAKRVTRATTVRVVPAMVTGSLLLLLSDTVAQRIAPTSQMPVGIVTLALGGAYLAWLIAREGRSRIG